MVIRLADSRGAVEKYSDCTVQDSQNWYCDTVEFSLGEQTKNRFGFDQGQYFNFDERRDLSDIRVFYISNWEYWYYKIREISADNLILRVDHLAKRVITNPSAVMPGGGRASRIFFPHNELVDHPPSRVMTKLSILRNPSLWPVDHLAEVGDDDLYTPVMPGGGRASTIFFPLR